jgi:hypothetical protein
VNPEAVRAQLEAADPAPDTCIYMDYGTEELHNHPGTQEALLMAVELLRGKKLDLTYRTVLGGTHCEASWEKQIPVFMQCLGL